MSRKITHIAGSFLIRAHGSFLNGGGLGQGEDRNVAVPKTFQDGHGNRIPYVSAQAWRRWLRNTLIEETGWPASELRALDLSEKGTTNKIAGELNPVEFAEDDLFGYMRAAKGQGRIAEGDDDATDDGPESGRDSRFFSRTLSAIKKIGVKASAKQAETSSAKYRDVVIEMLKEAKERVALDEFDPSIVAEFERLLERLSSDSSPSIAEAAKEVSRLVQHFNPGRVKALIRSSPFASSLLVSIRRKGWQGADEGFVHLKQGTPLPYTTEFYNADLQAVFSLDFGRLGTFWNLGDRIELDEQLAEKFLRASRIRISRDEGKTGRVYELTDQSIRITRARALLSSLAVLRGGAKQAAFGTDVSPKILILAGLTCGNPVFNQLFSDEDGAPRLKIETLQEIIADYESRIVTPVFVGIRKGYLRNEDQLREISKTPGSRIIVTTPIDAATQMGTQLV